METLKAYQLALASLPEGLTEHEYLLDTAFFRAMEQPDVVSADVKVHLSVEHKNNLYYCRFQAKGLLYIPCDRCLEPMEHPVDIDEELTVKYGADYDDSTDGILVIPESDTYLDLAPLLCDMLLLTIPMRHVHAEGNCDPAMERILHEHSPEAVEQADEEDSDSEDV